MSSTVSFIKLAYLIEIAVVLNLAYRELKFHQLDERLRDEVNKTLKDSSTQELTESPPYKKLASLITPKIDDEIKDSSKIEDVWVDRPTLKKFYTRYIRDRRALKIVNIFIVVCLSFLLLITASYAPYSFSITSDQHLNQHLLEFAWMFSFIILSFICICPLFFIWATTRCEEFLFGCPLHNKKGNNRVGKIVSLTGEINNLITSHKMMLDNADKQAQEIKINSTPENKDNDQENPSSKNHP